MTATADPPLIAESLASIRDKRDYCLYHLARAMRERNWVEVAFWAKRCKAMNDVLMEGR